jgi:hypothetical protein
MISVVAAAGIAINLPISVVFGFPSLSYGTVYGCLLHSR